jgi:hypothetical protein
MATAVNQSKLQGLVKRNKSLPETAEELGLPVSVIGPHFYRAEVAVNPKLKIAATPKAIRQARDKDGLRWERIAARTNMSVAAVKEAYEEAGGDLSASYTGRGRKPGSNGGSGRKSAGAGASSRKTTPAARRKTASAGRKKTTTARRGAGKKTATVRRARTRAQRAANSGNPS